LLRLYHFGPGDTFSIQTHVLVTRQPGGTYSTASSTPAVVQTQ
jgi:hypothetical protein